jgi:biopolymer transport protein ExbD
MSLRVERETERSRRAVFADQSGRRRSQVWLGALCAGGMRMSVSIEGENRKGRKVVNAELVLVPYIDLLTCMIAFLLITAVWTQLARLKVAQRGQGEANAGDPAESKIAVLVHQDGFSVMVNQDQHPLPRKDGELDYAALTDELGRLKHSFPDKTDVQVLSADAIRFESLIKTMDAAMASGFPDISLLDAASGAP